MHATLSYLFGNSKNALWYTFDFYSYDRNGTFDFFMGMGKVIIGIDVGMKGMCKWERRQITIPPSMGYGSRQAG